MEPNFWKGKSRRYQGGKQKGEEKTSMAKEKDKQHTDWETQNKRLSKTNPLNNERSSEEKTVPASDSIVLLFSCTKLVTKWQFVFSWNDEKRQDCNYIFHSTKVLSENVSVSSIWFGYDAFEIILIFLIVKQKRR